MNDVWVKMAEFLGRLNGESVSRAERKAGRNKGMSGGLCLSTGVAVIYSGICGLCSGIVLYGVIKQNKE